MGKADDDTFVIMENLREYLSSTDNVATNSQPSMAGDFPRQSTSTWNATNTLRINPRIVDFGKRFYAKMDRNGPVIYNHDGSGYVMSMAYVKKFVEIMHGPDTVYGTPAENMVYGVVMAYHDLCLSSHQTQKHDRLGAHILYLLWPAAL